MFHFKTLFIFGRGDYSLDNFDESIKTNGHLNGYFKA